MKFLSTWTLKEGMSLPPGLMRQLAEGQTAYTEKALKEGKIQEIYFVPGLGRFFIISDNSSAEDWLKEAGGSPMFMLYNVELYPLADYRESAKMLIENLRAAEKMMAGAPK